MRASLKIDDTEGVIYRDGDQIREEILDILHAEYYENAYNKWCSINNIAIDDLDRYLQEWDNA